MLDLSKLTQTLGEHVNEENKNRIQIHIRLFKRLLLQYECLSFESKVLLDDVYSLLQGEYWLRLELSASQLRNGDGVLFRRCLFHFAKCIEPSVERPSTARVFDTGVDLLSWYTINYQLGCQLNIALTCWNKKTKVADATKVVYAQNALKCLNLLCQRYLSIFEGLCNNGLCWFKSVNHFRQLFKQSPIKDKHHILESALLDILKAFKPSKFYSVMVTINHKAIEVTDLAESVPCIVEQFQRIADTPKFIGKKEHDLTVMTKRYITDVTSIRKVLYTYPECLNGIGLDCFKVNRFELLKQAKTLLSRHHFSELVLFLEEHFGHKIYRQDYTADLLPFYFKRSKKYKLIDYADIAGCGRKVMNEILYIHQSETDLLAEKNYSMETLHTRFSKLKRLLVNYVLPNSRIEFLKYGLNCLSMNDNRIQKAIFQQLQSDVKHKTISLRTGTSYNEVVRWIMTITGQVVIEVFKISFKRYQRHSRRLKIEDLYSNEELTELVFYIERAIREADSTQQLLALYFARIQIKSCWNTSSMTNIELIDITEVAIPTSKQNITLLIQKPRKGYNIDAYSLDGRTVNSVMRDILFVRDELTKTYRNLGDADAQKYLFIFEERCNVYRLDADRVVVNVKNILLRLGCRVNYNSMRIRKSGANHLYREVAKQVRAYESVKLHTFDTFIQHYQRINEAQVQQTLHTAVDVMQRYFTGREIDSEIRILMIDDGTTQKTPTGECASKGNDAEAAQYKKEHRHLTENKNDVWCSDFLACVWCKHFRTVADPDHVWQLLSYRDYVLSDMSLSTFDVDNNEFQQDAIESLHLRVEEILKQVSRKNATVVKKGQELLEHNGLHPYWAFAVTSVKKDEVIL